MKKISLIILTLCLFALNITKGQDIPVWQKMHYLSEEEMKMPNNNAKFFTPTDPPDHPVRMVAEYEHMQSVLVRYPFGLPTSLMAEMSQECGVTTLVANTSQQGVVTSLYQSAGANMNNIDFIIAPSDSYWTRDYGPWFVIDGNNEFGVCDFPYNRPRPNDNEVPVEVAAYLGINLFGMDLEGAGGNWMCTGMDQAASTDLVWEENNQYTHIEIDEMVDDYLGVGQYHVLLDPLNEYIKHIDCWAKYLSPTKVLIGQVPDNDPRYADFEFVANYFANTISDWGVPFEVIRVYTPGNYPYTPYTNSLILNKKVFVPQTGHPNDADALAVYEAAMPGYEIHGVMFNSWVNTDALHCRTKGIADIGMLHIDHMPLLGNIQLEDNYKILATFTNYSGSPLYVDSLLVYYRIDGGSYQELQMEQQLGNVYFANIPYQEEGTVVEYYIHGADESGRSANHPYIGAPDPHEFTVVQMLPGLAVMPDTVLYTTPDQCVEGQLVKIYPADEEDVTINSINQEEWDEFHWWSEPLVTFPYNLSADDSLILTVYISLPVDSQVDYAQDTMFIDCDGGDHEVLIMVDEDLISGINDLYETNVIRSIYPNPFEDIAQIEFNIEQGQEVSMEVYDIRGMLVSGTASTRLIAGKHMFKWDGSAFQPGIYHVVIRGETFTETAKMIKR